VLFLVIIMFSFGFLHQSRDWLGSSLERVQPNFIIDALDVFAAGFNSK